MSLVTVCHCGHDVATHFEEKHTCLGMRCDCEKYTHRDDPLPKKRAVRPKHASHCRCLACKEADGTLGTADHQDQIVTPMIHPGWCTCDDCMRVWGGGP